ncbi:MAG: ATP-grasp domain-containing protein [Kofleriaceae bacterium]|nr:ATP-grasp domain-containing protein [Kofleriaceae bacterium]MBP6841009.1 ATP-grasp domain-containing protein [Kofleriaceae bacterium]MBP9202697.1 ATP-grasp domain-containing protein [Kofleriaceae bacterium]
MHWILQDSLFSPREWDTLVSTLDRLGLPHSSHKVVPFAGELVPTPTTTAGKVICLGSYALRHAARAAGWSPGVYDLDDVDFEVQRAHWGRHLLNADSVVVPFAQVELAAGAAWFVRPVADSKVFAGQVVHDLDAFRAWQRRVCELGHGDSDGATLRGDTLVQVAPVRELHAEYRFWIVGGRVATASEYRRGGEVVYREHRGGDALHAYAQARVEEWQPHRAFCLDLADTPEGPAILEINTLNAAGFYAADLQRLIIALEDLEA